MGFFYPGACQTDQHGKDLNGWSIIRRCLKITICLVPERHHFTYYIYIYLFIYIYREKGCFIGPLGASFWQISQFEEHIWWRLKIQGCSKPYIIPNMQNFLSIVFGTNFYIGHSRVYVYPFVKCLFGLPLPKSTQKGTPLPLGGGSLPYYTTPRKTPLKTNLYIILYL